MSRHDVDDEDVWQSFIEPKDVFWMANPAIFMQERNHLLTLLLHFGIFDRFLCFLVMCRRASHRESQSQDCRLGVELFLLSSHGVVHSTGESNREKHGVFKKRNKMIWPM